MHVLNDVPSGFSWLETFGTSWWVRLPPKLYIGTIAAHTIEPCVRPAYQTNNCASARPLNVPIQVDSVALIHEAHSSLDVCAGCGRVQWSCGAQP